VGALLSPAWGCGGNVALVVAGDASSTSDVGGTTVDGAGERANVDASNDGPSVEGSGDGGPDAESDGCTVSASNYDQSCTVDTDCVEVSSGDYCSAATCQCGGSVVNVGALAQFRADVSKTPLGSGALMSLPCGCPLAAGPCCRQGMCKAGFGEDCSSPADTLAACVDAGGTCRPSALYGGCNQGAPDACAYSDEVCCVN
jgi:hypothetical protein